MSYLKEGWDKMGDRPHANYFCREWYIGSEVGGRSMMG